MLERERIIEIVVAVAAVFVMIGTMLWIGTTYGGESGVLTTDSAEILVGAMVGFIVLMLAVGLVLAYVLNEPDGFDDDAEAQGF